MFRPHSPRNLPGNQIVGCLIGKRCGRRTKQGRRHIAACAGAVPLAQRQQHAFLQLMGGQQIDQRDRHLQRRTTRFAVQMGETAFRLDDGIESGTRVPAAIGRDLQIDKPRIEVLQALVLEPELALVARFVPHDQHITALRHPVDHGTTCGTAQIERDGSLAAVGAGKVGRDALRRRFSGEPPTAGRITTVRLLYLDHIGPEFRTELSDHRAGENVRQFQYLEPGQGHLVSCQLAMESVEPPTARVRYM